MAAQAPNPRIRAILSGHGTHMDNTRFGNRAISEAEPPATTAHRPQSSSASRLTAGASGFLNFSQSGELPDR